MNDRADRIDDYLDALVRELRQHPRHVRRILAETEDHLREAIADAQQRGLSQAEAEEQAIAAFGSPRTIARRFAAERGRLDLAPLVSQFALSLGLIAAVGLIAVGVSGLLAAGLGGAFGKSFVSGDPDGVTYTPERCEYLLAGYPNAAHDCNAAAVAHHFDEVVTYRVTAGLLGCLTLGAVVFARRRLLRRWQIVNLLPDGFSAIVGAALFGLGALALLGMGSMQLVFVAYNGAGGLLSGGIVALAVFAFYARALLRLVIPRATRMA